MRIIIRVALLHQSSVSGTKARFFPFVPGLLLAARAGIVAPASSGPDFHTDSRRTGQRILLPAFRRGAPSQVL